MAATEPMRIEVVWTAMVEFFGIDQLAETAAYASDHALKMLWLRLAKRTPAIRVATINQPFGLLCACLSCRRYAQPENSTPFRKSYSLPLPIYDAAEFYQS